MRIFFTVSSRPTGGSPATVLAHLHIEFPELQWPPASVIVPCLALVVTIGFFWTLNARQGRLKSFEPHSFAFVIEPLTLIALVRLPLVPYNTGAKPIIVQNIRLSFPKEAQRVSPMPWRTARSQIKPEGSEDHALPAVFSISGRAARASAAAYAPRPVRD